MLFLYIKHSKVYCKSKLRQILIPSEGSVSVDYSETVKAGVHLLSGGEEVLYYWYTKKEEQSTY